MQGGNMQEYNEAMIWKIMYEQLSNQVAVLMNIYGKYDPDTLALLDDVPPEKRYRVLMEIKRAYVSVCLEILETEGLIGRINDRIQKHLDLQQGTLASKWQHHNVYNVIWLKDNEALLVQARSQFAMFRSLALVQAFESTRKRGSFLGMGKDTMQDMKEKLAMAKKNLAGKKNENLTDEENKALVDAGLDPTVVLQKEEVK